MSVVGKFIFSKTIAPIGAKFDRKLSVNNISYTFYIFSNSSTFEYLQKFCFQQYGREQGELRTISSVKQ